MKLGITGLAGYGKPDGNHPGTGCKDRQTQRHI
jgi:hypothetical protein